MSAGSTTPLVVVTDEDGNTSAVKPASTAALATDAALVVAVSPNNTVPVSAASLPLPAGAATEATLATLATAANQTTLGSQTTEINDGTNTAVVKAASVSPINTDPALVVANRQASASALTSVASSVTNVTLLAANAARILASVYNNSTRRLYLKLGATASASSFTVVVESNGYYEVPAGYTGIIDGLWNVANGSARVTELT